MYRVVAPRVAHSVTARNVAVIGTGYVGLTLRASLTRQNYQPEYTENSLERRAQLAEEYIAVSEAELTELAEEMLAAEMTLLRGSTSLASLAQIRSCTPSVPIVLSDSISSTYSQEAAARDLRTGTSPSFIIKNLLPVSAKTVNCSFR
jgi:UDP-glucose 6-dehydrogenase